MFSTDQRGRKEHAQGQKKFCEKLARTVITKPYSQPFFYLNPIPASAEV